MESQTRRRNSRSLMPPPPIPATPRSTTRSSITTPPFEEPTLTSSSATRRSGRIRTIRDVETGGFLTVNSPPPFPELAGPAYSPYRPPPLRIDPTQPTLDLTDRLHLTHASIYSTSPPKVTAQLTVEQFKSRHPLEGIIIPLSETTDDEMDEHIYAISEPAGFQQRDYIETEYWPKYASWISDDGTIEIREMTPPIDYGAKKREGLRAGIKRAKQGDGVFDSNPLGLPEEDGIWESEIRKELRRQKADAKLRDAWKDWDPMGPFRLGKGPVNCLPPQLGELRRALARSPSPDAKEYTGLMKIYEDGEKGVLNDDVDLFNQFCYWDEVPPEKGTEGKHFVDDGCKLDRDMAIFSALVISVDERHTDANIISSKPRRGPRINDISIESEPEDPDALSPLGVYGCNLPSPFQQVMERYERESCRPGR